MPGSGSTGQRGGPGGGRLGGAAGLMNALHGELVVADPSGTGTTTELMQMAVVYSCANASYAHDVSISHDVTPARRACDGRCDLRRGCPDLG
jgi:hypothetical protein